MKEEIYKRQCKQKLLSTVSKRINTTMIGALSSIEKHLGYLWGESEDGELTPEQQEFERLYEELRTEILDKGNSQIRQLESDLNLYEVEQVRYNFVLKKD